jgi:hypothetical protein
MRVRAMPINKNQIEEADAAIEQAVTTFVSEFESMWGRWEDVAPAYIVESALLALCEDLCELSDEMKYLVRGGGPATAKLLDAMAAYRDSNVEER